MKTRRITIMGLLVAVLSAMKKNIFFGLIAAFAITVLVACGGGGGSDDSSKVPASPGILTITSKSSTSLTLSWTDEATNETGYRVYRQANVCGTNSGFGMIAELPANTTAYTNSGLSPYTFYTYRVDAYNDNGESGFPSVTGEFTDPSAPLLSLDSVTGGDITLTWTYQFHYCHPSNIGEGYELEESGSSDFSTSSVVLNTCTNDNQSSKTYTVSSKGSGTYYYRVRACDYGITTTGRSLDSNTVTAVVP
jgi:hypothetical protein